MTVRVYRWDDASAPVLTGQVGSLSALLKACLVNGYGSKAAAGWTSAYSATNVEAFTNSSAAGGTGYGVKVSHTNAQYANAVAYESIDGSGNMTNPFPSAAQFASGLFWIASNTADATQRPGLVVADAKRFYMWVGYTVTTATGLVTTAFMPMFYAGDLLGLNVADPYRFMIIGGISSTASASYFASISVYMTAANTINGHYIARNLSGTTISKNVGKTGGSYNTGVPGMGTVGPPYPDPASGGMLLCPVFVNDAEATLQPRGQMPGLYNPIHNLPGNPGDTFTGVGALSGKSFILLDSITNGTRCRVALETSNTWE